jgi:hypothetical protein
MSLFDDLDKIIGQVGDLAKKSVTYYGDIIGATEDVRAGKTPMFQPTVQQPKPSADPGTSTGGSAAKSSMPLIVLGLIVLVFALRSR